MVKPLQSNMILSYPPKFMQVDVADIDSLSLTMSPALASAIALVQSLQLEQL